MALRIVRLFVLIAVVVGLAGTSLAEVITGPVYIGPAELQSAALFTESFSGVLSVLPEKEETFLQILTPRSTPTLYGDWDIVFRTEGRARLTILPKEDTFLNKNVEFTSLSCGSEVISVRERSFMPFLWLNGIHNGELSVRDFSCSEDVKLTFKILETGVHKVVISFGDKMGVATNLADCTGTSAVPCNMCDVSDFRVQFRDSADANLTNRTPAFNSTSGSCTGAPGITETWTKADGYSYCAVEGAVDILAYSYSQGDSYAWESGAWNLSVYDVYWDNSSSWCGCKVGSGNYDIGGTYVAASCCGDDASENKITRVCDDTICTNSTADDACRTDTLSCVYSSTIYANGTTSDVDSDGLNELCYEGVWLSGACGPPGSGNWNLTADCVYNNTATMAGNIIVNNGVTLTLGSITDLKIDFTTYYLLIKNGGTVRIKNGAKLGF